jgi:phosphoadenosine phosphosulfate reductase
MELISFPDPTERIMARHKRIAFQFSGGKDSTAALFFMREYWDRMTVYHCDSGDEMPETAEIVAKIAAMVPKFVMVSGRVAAAKAAFGLPVDLMPWTSAYAAHQLNAGFTPLMQDRVACCFRSVMEPLHERMREDRITLIVRGQKDSDKMKGPLRSGDRVDGFEFLYPVQNWTDQQCFDYMRTNGIEPQKFYFEGMTHSADCATCTAWMEDDRGAYLKKHHPLKFVQYKRNIQIIWGSVAPALIHMSKEVGACDV